MKKSKSVVGGVAVLLCVAGGAWANEPAGHEHAGQEHAGMAAKAYTAADIKAAMQSHIQGKTKQGGGTFLINDPKDGNRELKLTFVKIHDPVRKIDLGKTLPAGYFACTDFSVVGDSTKLYDIDFWLNPNANGMLTVTETRIHKHPEMKGGSWEKTARYTFVNDKPVEIK